MRLDSMEYLCCPGCAGNLRLTSEQQTESEVVQGILECLSCERCFAIKDGLPNLIPPETLEKSDVQSQVTYDQRARSDHHPLMNVLGNIWGLLRALISLIGHKGRCPSRAGFGSLLNFKFPDAIRFFGLGIWTFALRETRARRQLIERLELKKHASVLETGVGTGSNLPIIAKQIGKNGRLDGMDLSSNSLELARRKMRIKGVKVELIQGNAAYLPYKTAKFDAVLHVGAMNVIGDKKRAIEEMYRVAKPGAKIVIGDEGLAPGKEKTWLGRWILNLSPVFAYKPPVELVPDGVEDLKVYWVWQRTFWIIEFRKA